MRRPRQRNRGQKQWRGKLRASAVRETKARGRGPSSPSTPPEKDFDAFECLRSHGLAAPPRSSWPLAP
eukprot:1556683-Pyramimonas_sp.AAC.1